MKEIVAFAHVGPNLSVAQCLLPFHPKRGEKPWRQCVAQEESSGHGGGQGGRHGGRHGVGHGGRHGGRQGVANMAADMFKCQKCKNPEMF